MKDIKFPRKKKGFRDEEVDMEAFIEQVDANIEKMDREFKEFQRRYGADKSFEDWIEYEEKEQKLKDEKIQLRVKNLSSRFAKKLNSKIIAK
ncbi:Hypothetical protein BCD_1424 (plasmid) [Borrelia crocidurae DOU]|uniref:Uncharacterized protein n=1 Tax=Borrelia crocidurae DOU TaxID=1293575 RepID=W5SKT6_9SPIR|nr:hypothetical protein [Borrelia crocidurae]AHH07490.1 Hypothetical protein BCD_1424 [Borrelia crocidurae DOU]